jgi:ribosomal protein L11 methyltransferase
MKKIKPLWRVSVATSLEAEDAVAEMLGGFFGATAAAYFNLETGVSTVSVFRDHKLDSPKIRAEITAGLKRIENCGLKIGAGKIEIAKVKREDWAESWKRHFHPLEIGKSLLIKPSWSKKHPRKNQAVVILDPGLSFGTGQHPTTSFCLNQLVSAHTNKNGTGQSFLDIGTGSGILAIAAAKLGYQPVHACDFDPEAVRVAKENARKNRVDSKIKLTRGDITKLPLKPARQYDLVCANLISNLLISEKRRIVNRLKRDGILVLAGILAVEFGEVEKTFANLKLKLVASRVENEWCSGSFCFA